MGKTHTYAAYNKNIEVRKASSSGGVFFALAEYVIGEEGTVIAAGFDSSWNVAHRACSCIDSISELMQSKYVQSAIGETYKQTFITLNSGKKVLFCGTPCQIHGLLNYLKLTINHEEWRKNLITVDFICHGVPSPRVWQDYLREKTKKQMVRKINFRDKTNGWRDFSLRIDFDNSIGYLESWHRDLYMQGFIRNLFLRESCYECRFKGIERPSDFTIGDFWGVHEIMPDFFDDNGTSIIMVHNEKALKMLSAVNKYLVLEEIDNDIIVKTNKAAVESVNMNPKRNRFFKYFRLLGVSLTIKYCFGMTFAQRIKKKIMRGNCGR